MTTFLGLMLVALPMPPAELLPDAGVAVSTPTRLSAYRLDPPLEAVTTVTSAGLFLIADYLIKPSLEGATSCRRPTGAGQCDPADLSPIDRYAVGRQSAEWQFASDAMLYGTAVAPIVYLALESLLLPTDHPILDFAGDLLVVAEAIGVTAAIQIILKFAVRRPRPTRYANVDPAGAIFDDELSFPSGHVTLVSSATAALTATVFYRHPDSKVRYVVLSAGALLTVLTAVSRVEVGKHFPTDVTIGVILGSFVGFLVPYLHREGSFLFPTAAFDPATGAPQVGLTGKF